MGKLVNNAAMLRRSVVLATAILIFCLLAAGTVLAVEKPATQPGGADAVAVGTVGNNSADGEDFLAMLEAKDNKRPRETSEPSIVVVAISFIVKLALVLGLCYLSILGLKRFSNMKGTSGPAHSRIRVIENSQLGANRSLHLVEIGSRRLLVASTPSQVNLLAELDPVDPADVRPDEKPSAGMFKEQLATFLGQKPDSTRSAATVAELMRESNLHMQHKVREAGSLRGMLRNAWNK